MTTMNTPARALASTPPVLASHDEALERAEALTERLRERLPQGQELRRLPDANVVDLLESGLLGVMKSKHYGGSELGMETVIDVSITLASADPSTGWVYMLWAAHVWLQCLWPEQAMDEMFADPTSVASSVVTTTGDVTRVPGGFHWSGKGLFSSGVDHCDWLTALVPIKQDGVEIPEFRWLLLPRSDFEIIDDWNTVGLRGTGSKTIVVDDAFIPEYRTLTHQAIEDGQAPGREVNTHPMYGAVSQVNFTGAMSAPAIGAARGLVEAVLARYASKVKTTVASTNSPYAVDGMSVSFARLSHVAGLVDAAHAMLLVDAQRFGTAPASKVTDEQRKRINRNITFTAQQARRAANTLYEEGGGSGLVDSSIQQQLWRDANGAAAHRALTWDWQGDAWPKAFLGIEP